MLRKLLYLLPMFVTVGLGTPPNMPTVGGLIVIGFYEKKPTPEQIRDNPGIVLFDFEM